MPDPAHGLVRCVAARTAATILPRAGGLAGVADALADAGWAMPATGGWTEAGGIMLVRTAPHQVLALSGRLDMAEVLTAALGVTAGVVDMSDAMAAVRIAGPGAQDLLARVVPLDLDAMAPGHAARTVSGHVGLLLVQLDDGPVYELLCSRSFAASMLHMLDAHDPVQ